MAFGGRLLAALAAAVVFAGMWVYERHTDAASEFMRLAPHAPFLEQKQRYQDLLSEVGAVEAQVIFGKTFPASSASHILGHEAGRFLYETDGLGGIASCSRQLGGSCAHGFLRAAAATNGARSLPQAFAACVQERSIEDALDCAHGMGHALVSEIGSGRLEDAVAACRDTFKQSELAIEHCDNGVFMEHSAGTFGTTSRDWYDPDDPMFPCNEPGIGSDPIAHASCWFEQSQMTLDANRYPRFNGDTRAVITYCGTLDTAADRAQCHAGVAAQIRNRSGGDIRRIIHECTEAEGARYGSCLADAGYVSRLFGEHSLGSRLCDLSAQEGFPCKALGN